MARIQKMQKDVESLRAELNNNKECLTQVTKTAKNLREAMQTKIQSSMRELNEKTDSLDVFVIQVSEKGT